MFEIGDYVKVKSFEEIRKLAKRDTGSYLGFSRSPLFNTIEMKPLCGEVFKIRTKIPQTEFDNCFLLSKIDDNENEGHIWNGCWIEHVPYVENFNETF